MPPRCSNSGGLFEIDRKAEDVEKYTTQMEATDFWDNPDAAQKVIRKMQNAKSSVDEWKEIDDSISNLKGLAELAEAENDPDLDRDIENEFSELKKKFSRFEYKTMLSGPNDSSDAYLNIHSGAGGTESCDWADMLQRMYLRWAENRKYKCSVLSTVPGEEAGIKSATIRVQGNLAYGYLKAETGVHRLVRISPFDSNKRRHTSFASVDVVPEYEDLNDIEIVDSELKIDTYRASGAGGQHVNTTDSAVRITHLPTGVVVQCQNERSQFQNKAQCMNLLRAKLMQLEEIKRQEELNKLYGDKGEIAWGNQIRSYVLQPYQMVKDHRTGTESSGVMKVLDGDIDIFIEDYLRKNA